MSTIQRMAHFSVPAILLVVIHITKEHLLLHTEVISDGVLCTRENDGRWTVDHATILHVVSTDLREITIISPICGEELCHHSHGPQRVHSELSTSSIEALVAHSKWVDVTAILVTDTVVALTFVSVAASNAFTTVLPWHLTVVRCVGRGHAVCLPDVHLGAAAAILSHAHVVAEVLRVRNPLLHICGTIDELDVMWTLGIAIAGAILCTSVVPWQIAAPILVHLNKVHGTVHATIEF
mmetsp:Transcript_3850/g.6473  ORF Transcript_3850/g.6473 Transcript_3850/m.6473 type:complete len:237 (+) Transcript_3850:357-1067(+)